MRAFSAYAQFHTFVRASAGDETGRPFGTCVRMNPLADRAGSPPAVSARLPVVPVPVAAGLGWKALLLFVLAQATLLSAVVL